MSTRNKLNQKLQSTVSILVFVQLKFYGNVALVLNVRNLENVDKSWIFSNIILYSKNIFIDKYTY